MKHKAAPEGEPDSSEVPQRRPAGGYDSVMGVPDIGELAREAATFDTEDSRPGIRIEHHVIALAVSSRALRVQIREELENHKLSVGGLDVLKHAALVIADAEPDVQGQLAALRQKARADAAVLLVLSTASSDAIARANAAGAFACLRPPLVPEELLGLVTAALDTRAARVQAADLAKKLDLEAHLASIGRISAGLSHEVASPLSAATMNMEAVQEGCGRLLEALKGLVSSPPEDFARRLDVAREEIASFEEPNGLSGALQDTITAHGRLGTIFATIRGLVGRSRVVRSEPVHLLEMMGDVRKWLADDLRGVEVEVIGEPVRALADEALLGQLLQNLTSNAANAAKSLSAPRIRLHAYANAGRVVASVRDNGPGITLELQERIFEPFFTTRRAAGGMGLGLALCREYALQMGADLSLWSLPGRGACFRLSLPRAM
jgi:signal transduction histidine kinase